MCQNMAKKPKLKFWNKFCSFFSKLLVWSARRPEFLRAHTRSRAIRSQIMIISGQMVHAGQSTLVLPAEGMRDGGP